jgi:hypothetical protein
MSIAATPAGERAISDQPAIATGGTVPPARRITAKADPTLIPEQDPTLIPEPDPTLTPEPR